MKYIYVKNLQGDVLHILDNMGNVVVSYAYDAWGKVYSVTGSLADTLGQINPIRYRSYYYDTETGFYYLNSRYYDPEVKRFINADSNLYPQTGLLGVNLFAYCRNNPVNLYDENGEFGKWLKGLALAAVGVVAVVTSVATLGAATPLWVGVAACVGIAGGSACIVMGASEMAEAHTGTNVVKETVFNGDDQSYNTARNIAQASAEIGSGIAAVGKAATDYIAKKSITKAASSGVPFKTGQKVGTVQIGVNPNTLKINRPILPDKMKAIKFEAKLNGGISRPIQVYSNGVIYDGNHRVAYARQIGAAVDTIVIFN